MSLLAAGAGLLRPAAPVPPAPEFRSIRVIATADAGARLRPGSDFAAPGEPRRRLGGWRGLELTIDAERTGRTLLVDCGNFAAGSAEATGTWGRASVRFMNIVGYDAAAIGAREFAWGVQNLEALARLAAFPLLADPMLDVVLNRPVPLFRPRVILDRRGVRVALVGLTDLTANAADVYGYAPGSPAEQLRRYLPALAGEAPDLIVALGQIAAREAVQLLDEFPQLALIICPDDESGADHARLLTVPRFGQRLALADLLVGTDGQVKETARRSINVLPADSGSAGLERLLTEFAVAGEDSFGPLVVSELSPVGAAAALTEACRRETGAEVVLLPLAVAETGIAAGRPARHELRAVAPFEDRLRLVVMHDTLLHALARSGAADAPAPMVAGAELFVLTGSGTGWPRQEEFVRLRLPGRGPLHRVVTTEQFLVRSGMPELGALLPRTLTRLWLDYVAGLDSLPAPALPARVLAGPGLVPAEPLLAGLININTADAATLEQLPGVGPKTAARIIEQRTTAGPFRSVDDLAHIRGIGPRTVERLRPLVTVR